MAQGSKSGAKSAIGASVSRFWQGLMKDLFDPYRPERHYMRGPGPKWHEKHAFAAGQAS